MRHIPLLELTTPQNRHQQAPSVGSDVQSADQQQQEQDIYSAVHAILERACASHTARWASGTSKHSALLQGTSVQAVSAAYTSAVITHVELQVKDSCNAVPAIFERACASHAAQWPVVQANTVLSCKVGVSRLFVLHIPLLA